MLEDLFENRDVLLYLILNHLKKHSFGSKIICPILTNRIKKIIFATKCALCDSYVTVM